MTWRVLHCPFERCLTPSSPISFQSKSAIFSPSIIFWMDLSDALDKYLHEILLNWEEAISIMTVPNEIICKLFHFINGNIYMPYSEIDISNYFTFSLSLSDSFFISFWSNLMLSTLVMKNLKTLYWSNISSISSWFIKLLS